MASQETWQSPIAPGISWYQATVGERPDLSGARRLETCDVAIVGGGYTGLQAAYNLAKSGVSVVLIEACRFGDGASGRNGGQLGTGQRWWPEELEEKIGYEARRRCSTSPKSAKRICSISPRAPDRHRLVPGQMNVAHKASYKRAYADNAEIAALGTTIRISASWTGRRRRSGSARTLFLRRSRYRHRPYPSAEAAGRAGPRRRQCRR
jgi:gamma-glutamylputrescine oxidase